MKRAVVIGATGMMGPGIAAVLSLGTRENVWLVSRTAEGAERGLETARGHLSLLEENGLAPAGGRDRLAATSDLAAALREADFILESAPEDMVLKQALFAEIERHAPARAVIASNTSGLSITALAAPCRSPERVLTAHFWNPPHLMPLVEIVLGERTDPALAQNVREFLAACGKRPVVVMKDRPGQLGNRLQMALVREAVYMIQEGIASAEDIDTAIRTGFGLRLPVYPTLEHQDLVGLNLSVAVLDYVARDLCNHPGAPPLALELRAAGGTYHDWSAKDATAIRARRDRFLIDFLKGEFSCLKQ